MSISFRCLPASKVAAEKYISFLVDASLDVKFFFFSVAAFKKVYFDNIIIYLSSALWIEHVWGLCRPLRLTYLNIHHFHRIWEVFSYCLFKVAFLPHFSFGTSIICYSILIVNLTITWSPGKKVSMMVCQQQVGLWASLRDFS